MWSGVTLLVFAKFEFAPRVSKKYIAARLFLDTNKCNAVSPFIS